MKKSFLVRCIALMLALLTLVGCSGEKAPAKEEDKLTDIQKKSLAMLNYLTYVTQELIDSNDNKLFLESTYINLFDNTFPEAVDVNTQEQLNNLTNNLHGFKMLKVNRDRVLYIYEKNRAQILESATPSPKDLIAAVSLGELKGMDKEELVSTALTTAVSVVNMTVGTRNNSLGNMEDVEFQYLQDTWELDDEAEEILHNSRQSIFNYMLDMEREYDLPSGYILSAEVVADFISWKNSDNVISRIQFLESHQDDYMLFGEYWLVLAQSYYDNQQYQECIDAVLEYEKVYTKIFNKDYGYAKTLTMAVVSARSVYKEKKYIQMAEKYLPLILENSDDADWAVRYFVSQTYIDLYQKTKNTKHMEKAYAVMLDLVNTLVAEQRAFNDIYLADVVKEDTPKDATNTRKTEIKQYNEMLETARKTELPPISEHLRICTEMLLTLAKELNKPTEEIQKIENILHSNGEDLFFNLIVDGNSRFTPDSTDPALEDLTVKYSKGSVSIPVVLVTKNSVVKVSAIGKNKTTVFEDWTLNKVDRKGTTVEEFLAVYKSKKAGNFEYKNAMTILVEIYAGPEAATPDYTFEFTAKVDENWLLGDDVSFKRVVAETTE